MNPTSRAIAIAGAKTIAEECGGISVQAVYKWANTQVPAEWCPVIERVTDGAVQCEELRPDVDWAVLRGTRKQAA